LYGAIVGELKKKLKDKPILIAKNWGINYSVKLEDLENSILKDMHKNYGYSLYEDVKIKYSKDKVLNHYAINEDIIENKDFFEMPEVISDISNRRDQELGNKFCESNFFDSIRYVAKQNHGAILIFDQFEEILHSSGENTEVAMKILTDLVEYVPNIRIIVAFRKEYFADFNTLEKKLGGMYGRTIFLDHFRQEECQTITNQILKEMGILVYSEIKNNANLDKKDIPTIEGETAISEEAINSLINQCQIQLIQKKTSSGEFVNNISNRIDMLAYQSVMFHLFNWLNEYKDENRNISEEYLEKFGESLNRKIGYKKIQEELQSTSNKALYVWFNEAVDECVKQIDPWNIGKVDGRLDSNVFINLPVFMFIVDICPYLSSDTYKSSCDEDFLKRKIVEKNEIYVTDPERAKKHLSGDLRKTIEENFAEKDDKLPSFLSVRGKQFLEDTLSYTLESMQRNKILKSFSTSGTKRWEIRHDKLGEIANIWSEYNENTLKYALNSYLASDGSISFPRDKKKEEYKWLRFRAPYFDLEDQDSTLSADFINCDFTASVFENIHFKDCKFTVCNMEGVVFFDCTFEGVEFVECGFKGTMMKSRNISGKEGNIILNKGLDFIACDILISEFSDIKLFGKWNIYNKNLDKNKVKIESENDAEFSLSSIRVKVIKNQDIKSIIFHKDVKSNNLMVDLNALSTIEIRSTRINGLSLLGREEIKEIK
jgi:uncharacterized protein YjbI with pentapeptide repeats